MKPALAVFELHHLGDAVMALPFLRGASARFRPVVVCREPTAELLRTVAPGIETMACPEGWVSRFLAVRRSLRLGPRDAAACVWADPRAHALMLATGAGLRAGFAVNPRNFYAPRASGRAARLRTGRLFAAVLGVLARGHVLTPPLNKPSASQHHLESWAQLARSLGFEPDTSLPWIAGVGDRPPSDPPRFVLHAGGRLPTKRWPLERFEILLRDYFGPRGWPVIIVGMPGEPVPPPLALGQTSVETRSVAQLIEVFAQADIVVCNDSFPAHLAAAMSKLVVAVFGSGEPAWFAPFGSAKLAVVSNACPHRPCLDRCVMPSLVCLDAVRPEDVWAAVERAVRLCAERRRKQPGRAKRHQ